jgi:hypothetical protein
MRRSGILVAVVVLGGVARASQPADDPAVVEERDALIDKIARGEDVDGATKRFAALVKERDRTVATSRAAREAEEKARVAEREYKEAYRKSVDSEAGWRCSFTVDPKHPARDHDGYFRADWGRVIKKESVKLAPKNALDEGEPATLYEIAGQARHYLIRGEGYGAKRDEPFVAEVGDLALVCNGDTGEHDNTEPPNFRGSAADPSMRVPDYWRGRLQRHGFAARIAAVPKIAQKGRWNPIHITSTRYFWAIHDVKWKYPAGAFVLSDLTVGQDLGGGRWDIPVENKLSFVVEVPPRLPRREVMQTGHNAWMILGHPRFDAALHKLVLVAEDLESRYVIEK